MNYYKKIITSLSDVEKINISNNINTVIKNNRFNSPTIINNLYANNGTLVKRKRFATDSIPIIKEKKIINGNIERTEFNLDIFEKFRKISLQKKEYPTIRMYGLFTSLSILDGRNNRSFSYEQLLKKEKNKIENFIKEGFNVKVCFSMDLPYIFNQWGYKQEELAIRISNLCENIYRFSKKYKNLEVTIDTHNRLDGLFILGNNLLIKSLSVTSGQGYTQTLYENDPTIIANYVQTFDEAFYLAECRDVSARKILGIESFSDFIPVVFENRIKFLH